METDLCRDLFSSQPVARLATIGPERPHLVPVVFAVDGDRIVTVVDHKPKRTTRLQRIANIEANSAVALLADHYTAEWDRLWWVRADGSASILESGSAHTDAVDLLVAKYEQYRDRRPDRAVIEISVTRWAGWRA